jgi:hypothetical protein
LNNRLETISDRLLAPNQTIFVKGRYILESVVSAHKIIDDAIKKGQKGLVLKLEYEKAFDRVDWQFLEEMMITRGLVLGGEVGYEPGQRWLHLC